MSLVLLWCTGRFPIDRTDLLLAIKSISFDTSRGKLISWVGVLTVNTTLVPVSESVARLLAVRVPMLVPNFAGDVCTE